MSRVTAARCAWREEGGGAEAATRCLAFLDHVGIEVDWIGEGDETQLLDGLAILGGRLLVDPDTPIWPSDLLHEGGHIAVAPSDKRATLGPLEPDPTDEMMAIAWSFAAARQCHLPLKHLFHSGGYREDGAKLIQSFATGHYIGAPMLGYYGMCADMQTALAQGVASFPNMIRWLR
ncbi:hypothetical protein [Alteriqipengyuania lutimaris]|uniref:Uncharacterized protein n=1 Tax=Alteriqipengyuania lutimaris TaxID=1538146 RepID=A0A395LJB1_9SPHN|nr:hypothetical protein [Alteriqipengyuania lutimaris]MBB3034764.1 hypothetical protein [Alteriqipengyuania lutimaris]RDS76387.1 hypothetical protein DL238_01350 [Alteriqipengyuania lutimaris]